MKVHRGRSPGRFSHPSHYKPYLRSPFHFRCAYCQTHDSRLCGLEGMTVDHFRSVARFPHLRLTWTNLYYACVVCNSHYKKNRPTEQEERAGDQFLDVCRMDPDQHFRLEWLMPECRYIVASSTKRGLFTLQVLGLNTRPFLHDWWLELDDMEAETERDLARIRNSIQMAREVFKRTNDKKVAEIQSHLTEVETECLDRLARILERKPFPVAIARPRS